ncbi:pyridoxal phosphate-dependent transferase [Mycena capillaripes]|nr:pyridoxal phosphate-dependent transferase [Mycena capillaripes]
MSILNLKLSSALESRERQGILIKLPPPSNPADPGYLDFASNDYLSLSRSAELRELFLELLKAAPSVLGSGGSRVLVNCEEHVALEARFARFFNSPAALLATSGYDANVAFFRHIPQPGDIILHDEYVHASIHDGMRSGKARLVPFPHNDFPRFLDTLRKLAHEDSGVMEGKASVFLAVESVYSMDGSFAPLKLMVKALEEILPKGNGYLVVDEAHATGVYGPQGRGMVSMCGLEDKCLARLHTFSKSMTSTGAVLLTSQLICDYLVNHGRALFFTAAPSHAAVISVGCCLDILESGRGERLASHLLETCAYFIHRLRSNLDGIPKDIICLLPHFYRPLSNDVDSLPTTTLPTAIIPLVTPYALELSAHLREAGIHAQSVVFPAVPMGKQRVRVSVSADKTREDVDRFIKATMEWARKKKTSCGREQAVENLGVTRARL